MSGMLYIVVVPYVVSIFTPFDLMQADDAIVLAVAPLAGHLPTCCTDHLP